LASCVSKQALICYSLHGHASKPRYSAGSAWEGCICSSKMISLYGTEIFSCPGQHIIELIVAFIFRELHVELVLNERRSRLSLLQLLVNKIFEK